MLELGYVLLDIAVVGLLIAIGNYAINHSVNDAQMKKKKKTQLWVFMGLWQLYMLSIASTGFFMDFSFPPRFVLFLVLPALLFTGIFIYKNRNAKWIHVIPSGWLIHFQIFRVGVESLFVASVAAGVLHSQVTIEGYNYDMLMGISAPLIGFLVFTKSILPKRIAIVWNYMGLLILASVVFLFITTTFFPEMYGAKEALLPKAFGQYPFMLIPGFLMPAAVFVHILSIVQLTKASNSMG